MKKTLLYVDDEEINLFIFRKMFEPLYEVITASSGAEGIKVIKGSAHRIDLLISDLKMPDISGIKMIEQAQESLHGIPCFLLTGYEINAEIEKALAANLISQVFNKPFDRQEIVDALEASIVR